MAIKITGNVVIDDSRNLTNVTSITYPDLTEQTTAAAGGPASGVTILHTAGELVQTLNNPNSYGTGATDYFGSSVSISGNYAIVGAYSEGELAGVDSGRAYIFNLATGQILHTLYNPNAYSTVNTDSFGGSVAISGHYAIVGAPDEDDSSGGSIGSGAAYIFNVETGQLLHTLTNPTAYSTGSGDYFAMRLDISGNYAIVGAQWEDDAGGSDSGRAYIYNVSTGALIWTLNNPNPDGFSASDIFGSVVAISGNYAIVGAFGEDDIGNPESGKAYIFNVSTGTLLYTLSNPNAYSTSAGDYFGYAVDISGNYVIVGAYSEDDLGGADSGKVYIFNVSTGALVWTLTNPNAYGTGTSDYFGYNVAISGNYAIVGASSEDDAGGAASGKAYIYNVTTGALLYTLSNPNAYSTSANDYFGDAVAISDNYAMVGALFEDDAGGSASGKAYIFAIRDIYGINNLEKITLANGLTLSAGNKLLSTSAAGGQLLHTLNNPNAYGTNISDFFGLGVAISGNYAIVGAYFEDDAGGADSGKAYIFNVTTGQLVWTLFNPNAYGTSASDVFGATVSISKNYAIVGAYGEDDTGGTESGKAYIFNVSTGQLVWTLNNPTSYGTSAADYFGANVAISGNYAIVGAYAEDSNGSNSGAAYIFNVTNGLLLYTLSDPSVFSTGANDYFGANVAISGNYAIVGAYAEGSAGGVTSGAAYVYNVTTGQRLYTITNPNAYSTSANDRFGSSVAVSGNYAIVGAYVEDDATGEGSGKAYIFNVASGQLVWTLNNPNAYGTGTSDYFGISVSISGNYAIVGAYGEDDPGGTESGKAYIFDVSTGQLLWTLNNPNAYNISYFDVFGNSVAISDNQCIVGAYGDVISGGANSGAAYIFSVKDQTYLERMLAYVS